MKTMEHPDEFFQTVEVAHYDVFGYFFQILSRISIFFFLSYGTLPWEIKENEPIRGPLPQLIYGTFFRIMKHLKLDYPCVIVKFRVLTFF